MSKLLYKKMTSVLTAIMMSSAVMQFFSIAVNAENTNDKQLEYAQNVITKYLELYDVDMNSIYLSESKNIYNLDNNTNSNDIYIVFEEESIIGMLSVAEIDGNFYSSFEYNSFENLQDKYDNNEAFSLIGLNEQLYVEGENGTYSVYDKNDSISYDFTVTVESELEKIYKIDSSEPVNAISVPSYKKNLPVPIVPNESIGDGICWAAAIASKHDYLHNAALLASDVYNDLNAAYYGVPKGTTTWIERGFNYYGISCTTEYRMLNCVEVYDNIKESNPIYMSLTDGSVGHATLLSGITINSDASGIYRLVDSNRMSYIDVIVSADVMTADSNFVYVTNYGFTFTNWRRSHF